MPTLANRSVLITGAASGIGLALAKGAAERGAIVWCTDIDLPGVEAAAVACRALGATAYARHLDVTDPAAVERVLAEVAAAGGLDLVFNNAGIGFHGEFRDSTLEQWRKVFDVNVFGVIHVAHAAFRIMAKQGRGHLVNTASLAGLLPTPGLSAYGASKWAVVSLSESLRLEGVGLGVKVSAICPAFVESAIYDRTLVAGLKTGMGRTMAAFPVVPVEGLVTEVYAAIEKNRGLILYPRYAKTLYWLRRLVPWALEGRGLAQMRNIRKHFRTAQD